MRRNRTWSPTTLLAVVLTVPVGTVACGDDDAPAKKPRRDASLTTDDAGESVTVLDAGERRDGGRGDAASRRDGNGNGDGDGGDGDGVAIDASKPEHEAGGPAPEAGSNHDQDGDAAMSDGATPADGATATIEDAGADHDAEQGPGADADAGISPDAGLPPGCSAVVRDNECDRSKRPIVFVHGQLGAGDNFSYPAQLFASNGYCPGNIVAIDYNSITTAEPYNDVVGAIDQAIDALRDQGNTSPQVDLVAHGLGARIASTYLVGNASKVAHYIHIASAGDALQQDPAGVPTLCIPAPGTPADCQTSGGSVELEGDFDDLAIAASRESFRHQYAFLNGGTAPDYDEVQCGEPVTIAGRAVTFADNQPVTGGHIELHELGEQPRDRSMGIVARLDIDAQGRIPQWAAKRGVAYEFKLIAPENDERAPRHMYLPPFKRSDHLVRFLFQSTSQAGSRANQQVNYSDDHAVLVVKRRSGAFVAGRDRLSVDKIAILDALNAERGMGTLGLYLFDAPTPGSQDPVGDQVSRGGAVFRDKYVVGTDIYLPTTPPAFLEVNFNGTLLSVPNWPSQTEGMSLVIVD